MPLNEIVIRKALAGELDEIVRIDDEASTLYSNAGLAIDLPGDHPFVLAEVERLRRAIDLHLLDVAIDPEGTLAGFVALGFADGSPYLDQLSVRPRFMRRGLGMRLTRSAITWAETTGADALYLTTYSHLAWNRPYYERAGFQVVDEASCGPEMRTILREQRAALPDPDERVVMARIFGQDTL